MSERQPVRRPGGLLAVCLLLAACTATPRLVDSPGAPVAQRAAAAPAPVPTTTAIAPAQGGVVAVPEFKLSTLRPDVRKRYQALQKGSGVVYGLDPARSDIRIYAFRAGLGARFGHNHVLSVPSFSGLAWAPEKGLRGATADLGFRLADLVLDAPALRAATGGSFAAPLADADIRATFEHLVGEQGFQAVAFPWIEISATIEAGEVPVAIADMALTLHGETHHQRVMLKVQVDARHLEASGALSFRQGDFGLKPYAVLGGLLAVDDLVAIEFTLRGVPVPAAN